MKKLMIGLVLLSAQAFAKEGGNGGFVYVCGGKPELIDLKEVEQIPYLKTRIHIEREKLAVDQQIAKRLKLLEGVDPKLMKEVKERVERIQKRLEFKRKVDVEIPNDLGFVPEIEGCSVTNVINYKDYEDQALVEVGLYSALPEFDQAALLFHEALYKIARGADRKDALSKTSLPVRRFVAMLFSKNASEQISLLKEFSKYFFAKFHWNIERKVRLEACFDQKFLKTADEMLPLSNEFLREMKLKVRQFDLSDAHSREFYEYLLNKDSKDTPWYYYRQLVSEERIKGFQRVPHRCDGGPGESFVAVRRFSFATPTTFQVSYIPMKKWGKERELNGALGLHLIEETAKTMATGESEVIESKLLRTLLGSYQRMSGSVSGFEKVDFPYLKPNQAFNMATLSDAAMRVLEER